MTEVENLLITYKILVLNPFNRWKKSANGAYGIDGAYYMRSNGYSDPFVWCGGYGADAVDVDAWILDNIEDEYGEKERDRACMDENTWNKYIEFYREEIPEIIRDCGRRMTLKQFWDHY